MIVSVPSLFKHAIEILHFSLINNIDGYLSCHGADVSLHAGKML